MAARRSDAPADSATWAIKAEGDYPHFGRNLDKCLLPRFHPWWGPGRLVLILHHRKERNSRTAEANNGAARRLRPATAPVDLVTLAERINREHRAAERWWEGEGDQPQPEGRS